SLSRAAALRGDERGGVMAGRIERSGGCRKHREDAARHATGTASVRVTGSSLRRIDPEQLDLARGALPLVGVRRTDVAHDPERVDAERLDGGIGAHHAALLAIVHNL